MADNYTVKLPDKVRLEINDLQRKSDALMAEIERAEAARIPGMDGLRTRCIDCKDKLDQMKAVYFPGKK